MKKSILILASAVAANCAVAELVINENLSVAGFVDMSAAYDRHKIEVPPFAANKESDNHFAVDQVEVDFLLNLQPVTAQIELVAWDLGDVQIQQAFATYNFNDQISLVAGRFFSGPWFGSEEADRAFSVQRVLYLWVLSDGRRRGFCIRRRSVWPSLFESIPGC